jgi:hypothetical protein
MSTDSCPIRVVNAAPSHTKRADEVANENANIGKETAVIAVMSIICRKKCKSWSAAIEQAAKEPCGIGTTQESWIVHTLLIVILCIPCTCRAFELHSYFALKKAFPMVCGKLGFLSVYRLPTSIAVATTTIKKH